jgi:phosphoglycolate phosphatase
MNIIFDLDGTLIDSSERMYRLFCKLIPECGLSKEEYWEYKRNKINHKKLIEMKYPDVDFDVFNKKWMPLIESKEYLALDINYADTVQVLDKLYNNANIYLLTARQSRTALLSELTELGLINYFLEILTTDGIYTKKEVIKKECERKPELARKDNIFVSDMGSDIALGNEMGYFTVAITHGFMNENRLLEYNPKRVIHQLSDL